MNRNDFLPGTTFFFLFLLVLLYWSQAAFFGRARYKTVNTLVFIVALSLLSLLLTLRWIEAGHFPSSNLYESLLVLSWCFLMLGSVTFARREETGLYKSKICMGRLDSSSASPPHNGGEKPAAKQFSEQLMLSPEGIVRSPLGKARARSLDPIQDRDAEPLRANRDREEAGRVGLDNLEVLVVLSPLSLLAFGFAHLSLPKEMQRATALVPALQSNWLMMHVTVMILSYALLVSGSVLAIAVLISSRFETMFVMLSPKGTARARVSTHPELDRLQTVERDALTDRDERRLDIRARLDNLSYRTLSLGFPLLTIGIVSGAVWANEAWGSYWSWDPKETWALITWLVFAIYLHLRITKGWTGDASAVVAAIGFFVVWFCYLGVNLLGAGLHSYGWFSK